MARQERKTIRQMKALLGTAIAIGIAMAFSPAQATELTCESSHLSTPAPNLEQIAANLARLRLQIYQMPNTGEKSRANEEFKAKYSEFGSVVGNKDQAEKLFQEQMRLATQVHRIAPTKQSEREEKERKDREREVVDPIISAQKMIFHNVRPGSFLMGNQSMNLDGISVRRPNVRVEIRRGFAMMSTPVTQAMWARVQIAVGVRDLEKINPSKFKHSPENLPVPIDGFPIPIQPDHPVENVTWVQVEKWIEGLNKLSNSDDPGIQKFLGSLVPDHQKGDIYDFPTEAQWEFVMRNRGAAQRTYFDQDDISEISQYAWILENSDGQTHQVATRLPRMIDGLPFYDLEGNVQEWTKDFYLKELPGGWDPVAWGQGSDRVVKGSAYHSDGKNASSGRRIKADGRFITEGVGFRLVRTRP